MSDSARTVYFVLVIALHLLNLCTLLKILCRSFARTALINSTYVHRIMNTDMIAECFYRGLIACAESLWQHRISATLHASA